MPVGSTLAGTSGKLPYAAALCVASVAGCGEPPDPSPGRPVVVVSVPPQAHFVERIGGDLLEIEVMVPPGASPHVHEPTVRQMRMLSGAALYISVGHPALSFERSWMPGIRRANPELRVIESGAGCRRIPDDPHVWLSPPCAERMARRIGGALTALLPEVEERLERNLEEFRGEIRAADEEAARILAPHEGSSFLVFHPAWGYVAERYGLEQISVHASGAPGPAELAGLIRRSGQEGIQVVFVQPQISREAAALLARELEEGRVGILDPLARDWEANLRATARELAASFRR